LWKANWDDTRRHFTDWWNHTGAVVRLEGRIQQAERPHAKVADPGSPVSLEQNYLDPGWIAANRRHSMAHSAFPADNLPLVSAEFGPGSLATYLGSEPHLAWDTVWYEPCIRDPDSHPPLRFDPANRWWVRHMDIYRELVRVAGGNFLVGCPDIIENLDILAAMRDPQTLLVDLIERPGWVKARVKEITTAFFDAYDRVYDLIKSPDGGSCFGPFQVWGPGRTVKVQCDAAAMISKPMFDEFVLPDLAEQCRRLDYTMFHLDGTHAMHHLDSLLSIPDLDAIEWTPQYGIPGGGDLVWAPLYKRILSAGKSVQAIGPHRDQVKPLLERTGARGMYLFVNGVDTPAQAAEVLKTVEGFL
jgi:hypothetical protein